MTPHHGRGVYSFDMLWCNVLHTNISRRIPNLNHTQSIQPYVQQSNSIAVIDKSKLVPESAKKLAETIHTVEQPLVKVSFQLLLLSFPPELVMRKNYPKP